MKMLKYFPLVKVDEITHTISGLVTAEVPDKDGEICDYGAAKKAFLDWSTEFAKSTTAAGQEVSFGNMRLMHQLQFGIAGKVAEPVIFDDSSKQVSIITEPADDNIWSKAKKGFIRGFSIGGGYSFRKCEICGHQFTKEGDFNCPTCQKNVLVRFGPIISETSYVDNPCLKIATFDLVKADGSQELRKFAEEGTTMPPEVATAAAPFDMDALESRFRKVIGDLMQKEAKTKKKAGEDLTADCFAYVGDKNDPSTWKLPIKFSTDAKTKSHIRNALARFSQTQGIPEDKKAGVKAKIEAAAKKHGIEVSAEEAKCDKVLKYCTATLEKAAEKHGLAKDFYALKQFADVISDLVWLWHDQEWEADYEGDESALPEELMEHVESLAETFLAMAHEEVSELTAAAENGKPKGVMFMSQTNAGLEKAHSAVACLGKMKEAITAHHDKCMKLHKAHHDGMVAEIKKGCDIEKACGMHKAHLDNLTGIHKAHHDEMHGHVAKMHKILGSEEEGLGGSEYEPKAEDPKKGAAPNEYGSQKAAGDLLSMTKADFTKAVETGVEEVLKQLVKALEEDSEKEKDNEEIEEDGNGKPVKGAKKAAAGIGDRSQLPSVIANGGPHIRVMPVTKAMDSNVQANPAATMTPAEIQAAVVNQDPASVLKLMKGAQPVDVPVTLVPALSKLH